MDIISVEHRHFRQTPSLKNQRGEDHKQAAAAEINAGADLGAHLVGRLLIVATPPPTRTSTPSSSAGGLLRPLRLVAPEAIAIFLPDRTSTGSGELARRRRSSAAGSRRDESALCSLRWSPHRMYPDRAMRIVLSCPGGER
jgi:hypothetical protein